MTQGELNGWNEYRRMIIDWHAQDVQDRTLIRERLEAHQAEVALKLSAISTQLTELSVERRLAKWVMAIGVPAVISLAVSWLAVKFGLR
jgi:hypothetical protein